MLQVTSLPFSLAGPGQTASGGVELTSPEDASYTAAITTDQHSIFKVVKITLLRPTLINPIDDPGAGDGVKPHPHRPTPGEGVLTDEPIGSSDGVTPLKVLAGDKVQVTVQMVCPNDPDDTYSAILTITSSNNAYTTTVPVSVPTGQIDVQGLNSTATAAPGSVATWSLGVKSLAGPGANISFEPELDGITPPASVGISPITTFLPRRGLLTLVLTAIVGEVTPPGSYRFYVAEIILNGANRFTPFFLVLTVTNPRVMRPSPINQKYASLGGPSGFLGPPSAAEAFCSDFHGQFRSYANGVIYWSGVDGSGAFEVHRPTMTFSDPGTFPLSSGLGYPTSDVTTVLSAPIPPGAIGNVSHFQKGAIYWGPDTGVHELVGPIFDEYAALREAGGILGFPIQGLVGVGATATFCDFENGALFSRAYGVPAGLLTAFIGPAGNAKPKSVVLAQVNQVMDTAVQNYNKTADHQVVMEGGPVFQNPPITSYSSSSNITQNRSYKILQNFFVSGGPCPDITITLTFDLLLALGGSTSGGTDIDGKPTGPTDQSIWVRVTNAAASVDSHGNRFVTGTQLQQAHDRMIALANQTEAVIPLSGGPFLSLKILINGAGVGLSDEHFQSLGVAPVALLLRP